MSTDIQTTRNAEPPARDPSRVELPLFRFGLRQLLAFVTLASLLMAAMATWHGLTALVLLLATLVVGLHLFSTALGSQLRWHANRARLCDASQHQLSNFAGPSGSRSQSAAPRPIKRSPWHERRSTPLPWLPRLIVAASLLGAASGAVLLSATIGHRTTPPGIVVGSFSIAVVSGWFAFVGYSFYGVFRHGLRDAMADDRRDQVG